MKKTLSILILLLIVSCSEKANRRDSENPLKGNQRIQNHIMNSEKVTKITQEEKRFNEILDSFKVYKIQPVDSLKNEYNVSKIENYKIGKNKIQIFKMDSFKIDWIKINSSKFLIKKLKTINNPTDGNAEEMFCNILQKGKLYNFNSQDVVLLEFISSPCTGLGCSVTDYLIYDLKNNQLNLFESFRGSDLDFYQFPFNRKLNFVATDYKGDYHGATPIHFISRIYSLNSKGIFQIEKDSKGKEYYYETITYPYNQNKDFEYKWNWF